MVMLRHLVLLYSLTCASALRKQSRKSARAVDTCPWEKMTAVDDQLECRDGAFCTGWECCSGHGGRARCPPNQPLMCSDQTCGDDDYCCKADCSEFGGLRRCPTSVLPAVLMVGNSYIYYNGGVDGTLRTFFAASGTAWFVKVLTEGGSNLDYHLGEASTEGTAHHTALTSSSGSETSWGFVVFQEGGLTSARCCQAEPWFTRSPSYNRSKAALIELDRKAEARGATTVLYQPWGRRDGSTFSGISRSYTEHSDAVIAAHENYVSLITRDGRSPVLAPVGAAFRMVYDDILEAGGDPRDSSSLWWRLYLPDATHPSELGTYLAACIIYSSITGESPAGLPSARISSADASTMQAVAVRAVALAVSSM